MNFRKLFAKAAENWPAKILSLGLAIILFVFHKMNTLEERFFSVPLRVENISGLVPANSYPHMIRVSLRGEANGISPILEDDLEVFIDVDDFDMPGIVTVPVQWRKKGTALMAEPLQITVDPIQITLVLDYRIQKVVPLAASFRGQVEDGYVMTSYSLEPKHAVIDGPAELVWGITEIKTELINLSGARSDFYRTVNLLPSDPLVSVREIRSAEFHGIIGRNLPVQSITGEKK